MNTPRTIVTYLLLFTITMVLSCHKKDPEPDCGCEGKSYQQIKNRDASYLGMGTFVLFETGDTASAGIAAVACEIDSTWEKSENFKSRNYIVSGDLKGNCFTGPTIALLAVQPYITITSITRK